MKTASETGYFRYSVFYCTVIISDICFYMVCLTNFILTYFGGKHIKMVKLIYILLARNYFAG